MPVAVSVVNHRATDLAGQVVVSVPVAQVNNGQTCAASGMGIICGASFTPSSGYSASGGLPEVTYAIPLSLAAGVSKQFVAYVLAESPYGNVHALIRTQSGTVLAKASAPLPVAYGTPQPAVLVVTESAGAAPTMAGLATPTGSHPQLQYTVPADLPGSAAALGGFGAVTIDEGDTSVLSPVQAMALQGYVDAGGTLVVAGGLDWRAATAGLPPGLLPADVEGLSAPMALPGLARLLGDRPTRADVDLARLRPVSGASPTLTEGPIVLAVQAQRGRGQVILTAFDPLAPPLATWSGTTDLMSRVFAPAFQDRYYGQQPSVAVGPAGTPSLPHNVGTAPITNVGTGTGGNGNTPLLSPTTASQGLLGYLEQMPGASPPTPYLFGLLLLGYVLVVGPLCFWALSRLRRRELAWVVVPSLAIVGGLVLYVTGAGVQRRPVVNEVRVTQLVPGSHLAQLISLGSVYLPGGGSQTVALTGQFSSPPALIGDLGADAGAQLAVGAVGIVGTVGAGVGSGTTSQQVSLTVHGPDNSLGGWGASGTTHLAGTVAAEVSESSGTLVGHVTNNLGVGLVDTEVVTASGLESQALGALGPGASSLLHLAASSGNGVATAPFLDIPLGSANRQAAERHTEAVQSLYDLGAIYSAQAGGIPVLVAFADHPLYPLDFATAAERLGPADAVVVPLLPAVRPAGKAVELGPELVGSRGSPASSASQPANGPLAVQEGGSLDYQFVLPTTPWAQLDLNFGSLDGSPTSPGIGLGASVSSQPGAVPASSSVVVSAFDYQTSRWDHLRSRAPSGQLVVAVPSPGRYIGPGGAVEVRLTSPSAGLNVYGEVPTLSGSASRPSARGRAA